MLDLSLYPYIVSTPHRHNLRIECMEFLHANGKKKTAEHCIAVADVATRLAARFGIDAGTARKAAYIHDISVVMKPQDMRIYALSHYLTLDEAEYRYPFLLHQRISAVLASNLLCVRERDVLDAVACHTTLRADPSTLDMILFLADKLAWDQEGKAPFVDEVTSALDTSLEYACLAYIESALEHGMILYPHSALIAARCWLKKHTYQSV